MRISRLAELFNSMDPAPFQNRDLDRDAEEFIENWALEFSRKSHFVIAIQITEMPAEDPTVVVAHSIQNFFAYKALYAKRSLKLLLIEGQISLIIGLAFLSLCLVAAELLSNHENNTIMRTFKESLLIGGWVAMWRPIQIFLYEWWPIVRKRMIYVNLSRATVSVIAATH